jgi:hypothetical protein
LAGFFFSLAAVFLVAAVFFVLSAFFAVAFFSAMAYPPFEVCFSHSYLFYYIKKKGI